MAEKTIDKILDRYKSLETDRTEFFLSALAEIKKVCQIYGTLMSIKETISIQMFKK